MQKYLNSDEFTELPRIVYKRATKQASDKTQINTIISIHFKII